MRGGGRGSRGRGRGRGGARGGGVKRGAEAVLSSARNTVRTVCHMLVRGLTFENENVLELVNVAEEMCGNSRDGTPACESVVIMFYMMLAYVLFYCKEVHLPAPELDEDYEDEDNHEEVDEVRVGALTAQEKDDAYSFFAKIVEVKRTIMTYINGRDGCTFEWGRIEQFSQLSTIVENFNNTDAMTQTQTQLRSASGVVLLCDEINGLACELDELTIKFPKPFDLDVIVKMQQLASAARHKPPSST